MNYSEQINIFGFQLDTYITLLILIVLLCGAMAAMTISMSSDKKTAQKKQGTILGIAGKFAGLKIPIKDNEKIIIGRDSTYANIVLDTNCEKISRYHCWIKYNLEEDVYTVVDISSNGVFTEDNKRIEINEEVKIHAGKKIYLGTATSAANSTATSVANSNQNNVFLLD